jgi:hypothetical protein
MEFNDIEWLGEDDAHLGPAARAGLGILLAKGDWAWWHDPAVAAKVLHEAVPQHGVATWAGYPELLNADQWLHSTLAVEIGVAFQGLRDYSWLPLRIKVARSTWALGDPEIVEKLRLDLIAAMEGGSVFVDWPHDRRPRRAEVQREPAGGLVITGREKEERFGRALVETLPNARWVQDAYAADIIIGPAEALISSFRSAELAIVLGSDSVEVLTTLDAIRSYSAARCAVRLDPKNPMATRWLAEFGRTLSFGKTVDEALATTNHDLVPAAELIAATQTFVLRSHRFTEPKFQGEFGVLQRSKDIPVLEKELSTPPRLQRNGTPPPVTRVLTATVEAQGRKLESFPSSGPVTILLDIKPSTPVARVQPVFPDDQVEWDGDNKCLRIHMLEAGQEPATRTIALARTGSAESAAAFQYYVRPETSIDLRFVIADGARIIQTARLQGSASVPIRFFVETINAAVEREKSTFDLALMVNHSLGERPSAMALTEEGISLTMLDGQGIANARDEFRTTLQLVAQNPNIDIDASLFKLASKGKVLLDGIKQYIPHFPQHLSRVQLMTQADAYFPLEYLYDGDIPENDTDGLCPERHGCLQSGIARDACPIRSASKHLCPMGFVGVSAVIERQTWTPGCPPSVWLSLASELAQRQPVGRLDKAIFAAANRADDFNNDDLRGTTPVRTGNIEAELGSCLRSWVDWKKQVDADQPSLLVLVPHVDDGEMHIGESDSLLFGAIRQSHVGRGSPLVVAIGCNSAVAAVPTTSLPAIFKRNGARVVIAALTEVLGRYANYATLALVTALRQAANSEQLVSIGTLLTRLRRQLLAENLAIGMVLVAFGDADYVLGGQPHSGTHDV